MFVAVSLFEPFAKLLAFFYSIIPNLGVAIILLVLILPQRPGRHPGQAEAAA